MRFLPVLLSFLCLGTTTVLAAQKTPSSPEAGQQNPLSENTRFLFGGMKAILLRAVANMPEEHFGFRPTDSVRTYGQIVAHIADSQRFFCTVVLGEGGPPPKSDPAKTSKADVTAALENALAYCDRAFDGMTDTAASQMVKFHGRDMPKLGVLNLVNLHSTLHYGNLVTYMRMKGITPPTSEPGFQPQPKQ